MVRPHRAVIEEGQACDEQPSEPRPDRKGPPGQRDENAQGG